MDGITPEEFTNSIVVFVRMKMRQAWNAGIHDYVYNEDYPYKGNAKSQFVQWFKKKYRKL